MCMNAPSVGAPPGACKMADFTSLPERNRMPRATSPSRAAARREIAAVAARMMAEDGIADFGFAKRKAARQLGLPEKTEALPTNAEIEAELRAWQALYQD